MKSRRKFSAKARAKMSASAKLRWARPEIRAKIIAAHKANWADPEYRAKMSASQKARQDKARAELGVSPKEAEFILHRMEVRRAWLARNPHQVEAKLERARKRRERERQNAEDLTPVLA